MVTARIDLQGLTEELNQFKDGFDAWAQQSVAFAEAEKDKHLRHLRDLQTNIRNLHHQQQELQKRALEVQQRLHDEKEQVADLEAELSKVQAEQNALPALLQEVQAALDAEARSAEADASDFAAREASQQKTVSGVRTALQMYQQRLGLSFEHNSLQGTVDMVFTMIDSAQPQREFKLGVAVLSDDRYGVRSCDPPLPNIQELVDELNATNSFANFVRAAREAFQATVVTK
ncbi:hypothetical protein Ndes2526B_g01083 [Nannochloris sp. 'desiccata']|nr:hypothetical protein KSW81_002100 [Chlorella desiccata (nom. nud.)]KAH7623835.1 putative kinetochore protein SPC25 [Chlorella desiccata (nom. nud.)]